MSYCRWSSDNGLCDVYVYQSCEGGYVIHVKKLRVSDNVPKCDHLLKDGDLSGYMGCLKYRNAWRDQNPPKPIGLPYDGKSFGLETPRECVDKLIELRGIGYNVPQYAIDELIEESRAQ